MPAKKKRPPLKTSDSKDELLAHTYSETQLIAGAREGYRAHIGELQRRHGARLRLRISAEDDTVTADGIVSEVFMRLPEALKSYEEREKFEGFLWVIAKRILIDSQRQRKRRPAPMAPDAFDLRGGRSDRRRIERDDLIAKLAEALPPQLRRIWIMKADGYGNGDIATAEGLTANHVGVKLHRARAIVQQRLADLGLGPADLADSGISGDLVLTPRT